MSVNLLDLVRQAMGGNFNKLAAGFLGESEASTQSALRGLIPAVVGGVAQQGGTAQGASGLLSMLNNPTLESAAPANLLGLLGSGGSGLQSILKLGTDTLVPAIFGDKSGNLVNAVASSSGVRSASATNLLALAVPMVLGFLKKFVADKGLNAGGLATLLAGQGEHLQGALDSRITSALGFANPGDMLGRLGGVATDTARRAGAAIAGGASAIGGAAASTATAAAATARSGVMRWLPWVIAILVLWFLWHLFAGRSSTPSTEPTSTTPATTAPAAPPSETAAAPATAPSESAAAATTAPSTEANAASGLADATGAASTAAATASASTPPAASETAAAEFPAKVFFGIGSSAISTAGAKTIAEAADLAKKGGFKVDLTGYTDKTGNANQNAELAKARAKAVKDALVAAGLSADSIGMKPDAMVTGSGGNDEARRVEISRAN